MTSDGVVRTFLFLQGPPSGFFRVLGAELRRRGHRVRRINVSIGDWLFWHGPEAVSYRGSYEDWPTFLDDFVTREGVTDILYYGDRLPYHRAAREIAIARNLDAYAIEFGYLRPDWITIERGGLGTLSHFPTDPDHIREVARHAPHPDVTRAYRHAFASEAAGEMLYNLSNVFLKPAFPRYHADHYYHPVLDYLSWVPRLVNGHRNQKHAVRTIEKLIDSGRSYFVFPLQRQNDYQIRINSPYNHLKEVLAEIMQSFRDHAPADAHLVIKVHPLDNGLERWPSVIRKMVRVFGLRGRVTLIDGGDLSRLLTHARGTVLVNSTVGLHAIQAGSPLKVLGVAVFDIEGLSFQGPLDAFWTESTPPDAHLRVAFVRALALTTQVKGDFYAEPGRSAAAEAIADRILSGRVNEPGAYVDPPPRLARAEALGMSVL